MTTELNETQKQIDTKCINTIRTLSMDAVQKANSGHPGAPMGLASAAYVLWTKVLKHNPKNPDWLDRDRFVLSGGHASRLLYSLLHLTGYDVSLDDIKSFRQLDSKTPGHPEFGHTPGVETTTGPLGQGFSNAVGMAMAERHLAAVFNEENFSIVDHYTYVMCGDGDLMEGISSEAASLAGHLGLNRLICLYDSNQISIEGRTDITFTEDVSLRFKAYGWHILQVEDGNDAEAIYKALIAAKKESQKPTLIVLKTNIAYGSPNKQDTPDAHGAPLGEEEVCLTKECLGCPKDEYFCIPDDVKKIYENCIHNGKALETSWLEMFQSYSKAFPNNAKNWVDAMSGYLTDGWDKDIPKYSPKDKPAATRNVSGEVLNAIAKNLPTLIGGSADLAPSNKTYLKCTHDYQKNSYDGRNIRFGVREHAMGAIMSGMYLHNGLRPFGGTFLVFADYVRPAIRVASLMKLPLIYVFTHDSVAVGEDGPTHQPVEHLASLRVIPGLTVIRPADAKETAAAWKKALKTSDSPSVIALSRQNLPILEGTSADPDEGLSRGAYIIDESKNEPDLIFIASGSEVHLAIEAKKMLAQKGYAIRVVSMPSCDLFEQTAESYKNQILPPHIKNRVAIEAGSPIGWERYAGTEGKIIAISTFGASGPGNAVMEKFGMTVQNVVDQTIAMMDS